MIALVVVIGLAASAAESIGLALIVPLVQIVLQDGGLSDVPVIEDVFLFLGLQGANGTQIALTIATFIVAGAVLIYLNLVLATILAQRMLHRTRMEIFETALHGPILKDDALQSGKFMNYIMRETFKGSEAMHGVLSMIINSVAALVFVTILILISPQFTLVIVLLALAMTLLISLATWRSKRLSEISVKLNNKLVGTLSDFVAGIRVVRGMGSEDHERGRIGNLSRDVRNNTAWLWAYADLQLPITSLMSMFTIGVIVWLAIANGDPISSISGYIAIVHRLQPRISAIVTQFAVLRGSAGSISAVYEALPDRQVTPRTWHAHPGSGQPIKFRDVGATYPGLSERAVRDISFTLLPGQVTAIVGRSGAGKSTIVNVLLRFLPPDRGTVQVGERNLFDIDPEQWHHRLAFVEQDAYIFDVSIRENIAYARPDADLASIRKAARTAQADDFIMGLPDGYDTVIGAEGIDLSKGQRQRLAIARAILRDPDILILDEATNALDRPTEHALRNALQQGRGTRTTLVIAHRLETVENADHVIVMEDGRIVEQGTAQQLSGRAGVFADLFKTPENGAP